MKIEKKRAKYELKESLPFNKIYLDENHVLANEVCEILDIHMSNISNLKSETILKLGNCPILSKKDVTLPNNIRIGMNSHKITSLKDKMVLTHFKSEYNLNEKEILEHIAERFEIISDKKFIVYKPEFIKLIKTNKIKYDNVFSVITHKELNELQSEMDFKFVKIIKNNKALVIY